MGFSPLAAVVVSSLIVAAYRCDLLLVRSPQIMVYVIEFKTVFRGEKTSVVSEEGNDATEKVVTAGGRALLKSSTSSFGGGSVNDYVPPRIGK